MVSRESSHDLVERARYLRALWPNGLPQYRYINYWLPPGTSYYVDSLAVAETDVRLEGENAYIGVGLGSVRKSPKQRFTKAEITTLPGVFLDIDFKNGFTEERACQLLNQLLPYTMLVATGGGLHAYWLFNRPVEGNEEITRILQGWKNYVAIVPDGKSIDLQIIEPSRILRLPGSINYKYEHRPVVRVIELTDERYEPNEIPQTDFMINHHEDKAFYTHLNSGFSEGRRNDTLYRWACSLLRTLGAVNEAHIIELCRVQNEYANNPPLGDAEVVTLARSAFKFWIEQKGGKSLVSLVSETN